MMTYQIILIHPKVILLLQDLVELELISIVESQAEAFQKEAVSVQRNTPKRSSTDDDIIEQGFLIKTYFVQNWVFCITKEIRK